MITSDQIRLYGRRWGAVCRANGWRTQQGRLVCDEEASAARSDLHADTWRLARVHAGILGHEVGVDDLRRAVTALAAGGWASTKELSNTQFSRLLALIGTGPRRGKPVQAGLLIDPEDLHSLRHWQNPELDEIDNKVWFLENQCEPAYVAAVSRDKFGTSDWRSLDPEPIRQLWLTLHARTRRGHGQAALHR